MTLTSFRQAIELFPGATLFAEVNGAVIGLISGLVTGTIAAIASVIVALVGRRPKNESKADAAGTLVDTSMQILAQARKDAAEAREAADEARAGEARCLLRYEKLTDYLASIGYTPPNPTDAELDAELAGLSADPDS